MKKIFCFTALLFISFLSMEASPAANYSGFAAFVPVPVSSKKAIVVGEPDPLLKRISSSLAKNVKRNPERYLPELVHFFRSQANNQKHLVRLFHDWLAVNIRYDVKAYTSGRYPDQDFIQVIKSGMAVCSGYSNAFDKMCELARIKSEIVSGYSRGYGFSLYGSESMDGQKHSWNAVQCDGVWYLIDITWDAGFIEDRKFVQRYSVNYLFPEAHKFIYSHFPDQNHWQLLDRPISSQQFRDLPDMRKEFFTYGIDLLDPVKKVNKVDNSYSIRLKTAEGVKLKANVFDSRGKKIEGASFSQQIKKDTWQVDFYFLKAGKWQVLLYAKTENQESYSSFGQFGVQSRNGTKQSFPTKYKKFDEYKVQILSPNELLRRNKSYNFKLKVPNAESVSIVVDNKWTKMQKTSGDIYQTNFKIPSSSELMIYVKKNPRDKLQNAVLKWKVQ